MGNLLAPRIETGLRVVGTGVSLAEFIDALDQYLHWYNEKRIKMSLGAMSPIEYRRSLRWAV